jgi:hypothetical protein
MSMSAVPSLSVCSWSLHVEIHALWKWLPKETPAACVVSVSTTFTRWSIFFPIHSPPVKDPSENTGETVSGGTVIRKPEVRPPLSNPPVLTLVGLFHLSEACCVHL